MRANYLVQPQPRSQRRCDVHTKKPKSHLGDRRDSLRGPKTPFAAREQRERRDSNRVRRVSRMAPFLHRTFIKKRARGRASVVTGRFYGLMKVGIGNGTLRRTERLKSISPDNPRLTARTFLGRQPGMRGAERREGEEREESTGPALEIIIVITRSCGTASSDRRYKEKEERGCGRRRRRRRKKRRTRTIGRKGRVLSEDTISSRNVLRFYWKRMGVAEREREREREARGTSATSRASTRFCEP